MKYMSQGASSIYEVITHNPRGLERLLMEEGIEFSRKEEMGWGSSMSRAEGTIKAQVGGKALGITVSEQGRRVGTGV